MIKRFQNSNYLKKGYRTKYNENMYKSNYNNYHNSNVNSNDYNSYYDSDDCDFYGGNNNGNKINLEETSNVIIAEKENTTNEKNNNDKKIEFHSIKESTLIKVYENHYESIINELKNISVKKEKEITIDDIKNKCKEKKYALTEEDASILKDMENLENNDNTEYYNEYMFFKANKKSIYVPHILKSKSNILSIFIDDKKLLTSDFQICPENNYIFFKILEKRLLDINNNSQNYSNNSYGLTTTIDNSIGILYTSIDEKFVREILLKVGLESSNIKLGSISLNKINPTDLNFEDINNNYIRGLTVEELILLTIYYKLGMKNIRKYPRLLLYETNCFITGEPVLKYIQPGFREIDCILESFIDYTFTSDDSPLIIQKLYKIENMDIKEVFLKSKSFEIKAKKLYFFEIKNTFPNNIIEAIKRMLNNVIAFKNIFIKNKIIDEQMKLEVVIIYDFQKTVISSGISKALNLNKYYYDELEGLEIKIIYCKSLYTLCALTTVLEKLENMEKDYKNMQNNYESLLKKMAEMQNQLDKINAEKNNNNN